MHLTSRNRHDVSPLEGTRFQFARREETAKRNLPLLHVIDSLPPKIEMERLPVAGFESHSA
jgi:hypothetical protein